MQIIFFTGYIVYVHVFVMNAKENQHFSQINSNWKETTIVFFFLIFITMLVLYQTNSLSKKKDRSPSKIKSYKSFSNMAAGHCSLLKLRPCWKNSYNSYFWTVTYTFFRIKLLVWYRTSIVMKIRKKNNGGFFSVAIYMRKMLISLAFISKTCTYTIYPVKNNLHGDLHFLFHIYNPII